MDIDISGVDKAKLLAALHNGTQPLGLGFLHAKAGDMTVEEAQALMGDAPEPREAWFDYVRGRPVKVGFKGDVLLRADLYDRDAPGGEGSCQRIVDSLRGLERARNALAWKRESE